MCRKAARDPFRGNYRMSTATARITRTRVNSTNTPTNTRTIGSISSICPTPSKTAAIMNSAITKTSAPQRNIGHASKRRNNQSSSRFGRNGCFCCALRKDCILVRILKANHLYNNLCAYKSKNIDYILNPRCDIFISENNLHCVQRPCSNHKAAFTD